MGLCNPYTKLTGETCRPSRRAEQPSVQLCAISPAFHPGHIWVASSIYTADVKTLLPIKSLQLSSHTCFLTLLDYLTKPQNFFFFLNLPAGFLPAIVLQS